MLYNNPRIIPGIIITYINLEVVVIDDYKSY